jgi:hypothetical protein
LAEAGRGTARAHTYNLGLARTVLEVRLARGGPSRLGLGRRREHGRQLDGHLLGVARMRFPRLRVGTSSIEFLTWFDTTLTPPRPQQQKGLDSMTGPYYCKTFNPHVISITLTVYFFRRLLAIHRGFIGIYSNGAG